MIISDLSRDFEIKIAFLRDIDSLLHPLIPPAYEILLRDITADVDLVHVDLANKVLSLSLSL